MTPYNTHNIRALFSIKYTPIIYILYYLAVILCDIVIY